ncbi:MAG: glycosyltransferase family 39 protein [Patescibacteria group bacterium]
MADHKKKLRYLLLLFIIYNSFFLNKAFHIDDPFTIGIAEAINKNPVIVPFEGDSIARIIETIPVDLLDKPLALGNNPLLIGYYYAPIIRFLGEREFWLHLFLLPFSVLAIISMYFLSSRFVARPFLPTLLLVISPVFLIMSQSIMLDIPLLSFFLLSATVFIYGVDKDNIPLLFLSGLLAGLASLIKYSGLLLIALMALYILIKRKQKRYYLFLLIPLAIFIVWCGRDFLFYGKIYFLEVLSGKLQAIRHPPQGAFTMRIFAFLSFLSGVTITPVFFLPWLTKVKRRKAILLVSLVAGFLPVLLKNIFMEYTAVEKTFLAMLFISSTFIICIMIEAGINSLSRKSQDNDKAFLALWFLLVLVFTVVIQFVAARFLLLLLPPMFIIIYQQAESSDGFLRPLFKNTFKIAVLFTLVISTVLAAGDYYSAGLYRDFIVSLKNGNRPYREIYICPASYYFHLAWGYAYYVSKYYPGLLYLDPEPALDKNKELVFVAPTRGVLPVAINKICCKKMKEEDYSRHLIKRVCYKGNVTLHHRNFRAGFYSHDWGLLPFHLSFCEVPLEAFEIYSLNPKTRSTGE